MKLYKKQFLEFSSDEVDYDKARFVVLPVPYEGGISYGGGAANGPDAILDASYHLELYDEVLDSEPYKAGVATLIPPQFEPNAHSMVEAVKQSVHSLFDQGKFPIVIGGDHSVTNGSLKAIANRFETFSFIQFDAHSDLRESYDGSLLSHASIMARVREKTDHTLQIGQRSISKIEMDTIRKDALPICTMHEYRSGNFDFFAAISKLPNPVFITFDVDVFDWSVIRSTGTPEPGGMLWDEALELLQIICQSKEIIGFDIVELCGRSDDTNSAFAAAKLIYKIIGFIS